MKILIVSGSRADVGLLHCPEAALRKAGFECDFRLMWENDFATQFSQADELMSATHPDLLLVLGDRFEILATATAAHLQRIPIAHIAGGDVSEGSYDDAMRDCVSRMATLHFTTSSAATARLVARGYSNVHLVGNPAVDYIMHENWRRPEREVEGDYVLVGYYPETIDGTSEWDKVIRAIAGRKAIVVTPNLDRGAGALHLQMVMDARIHTNLHLWGSQSHDGFLNLLLHCQEFIGNSSSIFYEAPWMRPGGVPCILIGKRQRGRAIPWGGEGRASERIADALKRWNP